MTVNTPSLIGLIVTICLILIFIRSYIKYVDSYNDEMVIKIKNIAEKLTRAPKGIPVYAGKKSNTDKEEISLCVKDENGNYYTTNTLIQVLLHEYAHCMIKERGHTQKFYETMNYLREEAIQRGILDPRIPVPCRYCGDDFCRR